MLGWLSDGAAWAPYANAAAVIGGFATGIGILVGGVSLLMIWLQTRHGARVANQTSALEAHKDYIRLCVEHPELSSSHMMRKHLRVKTFDKIFEEISPASERALWFMSYVLFAMEQLILVNTRWGRVEPAWGRTVEDQLGYHADLLKVVWPEWQSHYSDAMGKVAHSVLNREFHSPIGAVDVGRAIPERL